MDCWKEKLFMHGVMRVCMNLHLICTDEEIAKRWSYAPHQATFKRIRAREKQSQMVFFQKVYS